MDDEQSSDDGTLALRLSRIVVRVHPSHLHGTIPAHGVSISYSNTMPPALFICQVTEP